MCPPLRVLPTPSCPSSTITACCTSLPTLQADDEMAIVQWELRSQKSHISALLAGQKKVYEELCWWVCHALDVVSDMSWDRTAFCSFDADDDADNDYREIDEAKQLDLSAQLQFGTVMNYNVIILLSCGIVELAGFRPPSSTRIEASLRVWRGLARQNPTMKQKQHEALHAMKHRKRGNSRKKHFSFAMGSSLGS